jgi:aryl-alcohol dehydrogenase-like predicted oxidoreductase
MKATNKLILGTVQFGLNYGINNSKGKPEKENVFQILSYAYESGIRYLDTAELYGNAHDLIGEFHKLYPTKKFEIITKFPHEFESSLDVKINTYLDQLFVNHLHAILFHSYDSYVKHRTELNGKINKVVNIGVSVYTNAHMKEVINDTNIDIIQLPFNLFDNTNLRGDLLKKAKEKNKIIHTRSAFLQGLFFMKKDSSNKIRVKLEKELDTISEISLKYSISLGTLALNYCLQQPQIDGVLIGVDSLVQLKENIEYAETNVSDEYMKEINAIRIDEIELLNPSLWK